MSRMEMIYVASDGYALKAGVGAAMETNAMTWAAFNSYRHLEAPKDRALILKGRPLFLLDYYNAKGDLADTIRLDATGFEAISGEKIKAEAEYRKIDADYWAKARAEYDARKKAT